MKNIKRTFTTGALSLLAVLCFSQAPSSKAAEEHGGVYIDVGQAQIKKSILAFTPLRYFGAESSNKSNIAAGDTLYKTVYKDLDFSNYFTFLDPDAYLENPSQIGLKPAPGEPDGFHFSKWKTAGTEFLIRAGYRVTGKKITLDTYVYHVPQAKIIMAQSYTGDSNALVKLAHTFANDLIKSLTGKDGIFLTKFAAVRQVTGKTGNQITKEIYVLDWDGSDQRAITNHDSISTSPAWSTSGTKVAYTSFAYHKKQKVRNADLFIYDMKNAKRFLVSYRKGINSGADFFPGDQNLLLTLSRGGIADIYKMSEDGNSLTQLTKGPAGAMNVEPALSPDGKEIAFSSDRSGRPMIYVMNVDGSNPRRMTFAGKYNATPAWSPDGKTLAFAGYDKGHFDLFTIKKDKTGLTRLTDAKKPNGTASNNESPSWSPDGRHIVFVSDRSGTKQIYTVSPDGTNERQITKDGRYSWDRPKWSPYLND
jgi:TolB protein